ncbi:MAG: reductive dehalogenase [Candidatus Hodarchaeota archaeon]
MTDNLQRSQLEKDFKKGKIPFAIDREAYHRFSQRNTIFARVVWDESYLAHMRPITERAAIKVGRRGYSRVGYAAQDASWTIYDHFYGAFDWNSVSGQVSDKKIIPTQLKDALPHLDPTDAKSNTMKIKKVAQIFGACEVGIAKLEPDLPFIFTRNRRNEQINFPEGMGFAIVMLIEMDYFALKTSPALPASITTGNGYSRMAFAIACMAEFLRKLGYKAIPSGNDTGLSVPLAIKAGLGQFGRNGLLINPKYGQRVRICKVFTDLPLIPDKPIDFGVTQFCRLCKKCAQYCPSQSITYDTDPSWESPWDTISNNNGVYKWYVNVDTCYDYWVKNSADCSNCIRICPFTKPPGFAHDVARFFIKNFRFLDRMWVWMDDLMSLFPWWRYGKKDDPEKFWRSKHYLGKSTK